MWTLFTQSKESHFPYGNAFSLNKDKRETPESSHTVLLKKINEGKMGIPKRR